MLSLLFFAGRQDRVHTQIRGDQDLLEMYRNRQTNDSADQNPDWRKGKEVDMNEAVERTFTITHCTPLVEWN